VYRDPCDLAPYHPIRDKGVLFTPVTTSVFFFLVDNVSVINVGTLNTVYVLDWRHVLMMPELLSTK
jgi:hypothetical protein